MRQRPLTPPVSPAKLVEAILSHLLVPQAVAAPHAALRNTYLREDLATVESSGPLSRRIRQSAQVVSSRLGDAGVLVNLRTNRIFELNATGQRVWELADEGRCLDEIEETLLGEFAVDAERLRRELMALVDELSREGLIE